MINSLDCYKVKLAQIQNKQKNLIKYYIIVKNNIPCYEINGWLEEKGIKKITTGKEYAYKLAVFLNYLNKRNLKYEKARLRDVKLFIKYLVYGLCENVFMIKENVSFSTINKYLTVITGFYLYLDDMSSDTEMVLKVKDNKKRVKNSFYYGQIWKYDYSYLIEKYITNMTPKKEYIKWYSEEQKEGILSNFNTLRDKAVFKLTLEALRIDEVISIRMSDYDSNRKLIRPSRSKGKETQLGENNDLRPIFLPDETARIINDYIYTERADVEAETGIISDFMFINLRKGEGLGEVLKYRTYIEILKRCAKRAGLNRKKIRTHSGRSTKIMELIEHQAEYPEDGITNIHIKEFVGMKELKSLEPYINHNNEVLAKTVYEKTHKGEKVKSAN